MELAESFSNLVGEVRIVDDVASEFVEVVAQSYALRARSNFAFALSGGPTAQRCYERLSMLSESKISWWDVDIYWGDERCVPPDHPDSNEAMARRTLLNPVGAVNSVYPMRGDEGASAYQLRVSEVGFFDLIHLGVGPDGHTASIFPGSDADSYVSGVLVQLNTDPTNLNPHTRMTLTYPALEMARHIVFTVSGESKRDAVLKLMQGIPIPANKVRADKITWILDHEALPNLP